MSEIDLIDRFINNELSPVARGQFESRCLTDEAFRKEVDVYKKIYEGMEQLPSESLFAELETLYQAHDKEGSKTHILRPVWKRGSFYALSAVAASLVVIVGAYWYFRQMNETERLLVKRNKISSVPLNDTSGRSLKDTSGNVANVKKSPGEPNFKNAYALTDQVSLPASAIRQAFYPQELSYTFNGNKLTIYGDPALGLLSLEIFKKQGQYYMQYDGVSYVLRNTTVPAPFDKVKSPPANPGNTSSESVDLQIAPLKTQPYRDSSFSVFMVKNTEGKEYYFLKEKNKTILALQSDIDPGETEVILLSKNGKTSWYIVNKNRVFAIDAASTTRQKLEELSPLSSADARLFLTRRPVKKAVSK